jgi:hypothetical protein
MDRVHFCSGSAPLCRSPGALWCTILRDAVTCPACLAALAVRDEEAPLLTPRPGAVALARAGKAVP